jgi:hypothetical protein
VDPKELRRLAAEVDEEHRDTMRTVVEDMGETFFGTGASATAPSRRSFLRRVGVSGLVAGVGAVGLARPAAAQTASSTTSTTLPARPTADDLAILGFAQSVELAAVAAYGAAAATGKISSDVLAVAVTFQGHHREHAQAIAGLAGSAAPGKPNQKLLAEFGPKIAAAGTEKALLEIAYTLEMAAAATYAKVVELFKSADAVHKVVAIGPIEARHAVVLGTVLGKSLAEMIPSLEPTSGALLPTAYPIGG